jgi:PAS domain S-box-containing protein
VQLVDSAKGQIPRTLPRPAWLPLAALAALMIFFYVFPAEIVLGGMNWIPTVNMVFTTLGALLVAALAAVSYLGDSGAAVLPLGAGMLAFGVFSLLANLVLSGGRINSAVAIGNLGYFLAGLSSLYAATRLLWFPQRHSPIRPGRWLIGGYGAVLLLAAGIFSASFSGIMPTFFVPGVGSTWVRFLFLGVAIAEFALTASLLWIIARRNRSAFLSWYSLGIALVAMSMAGSFGYRHIDSLNGWAVRVAIYMGSVYMGVAMVIAVRQSGRFSIPLSDMREIRLRYASLVDTMPDAILVHVGGRYVFANPAAAVLFGAKDPRALLGRAVLDLVHPDSHHLVKNSIGYHSPIGESSGTTELTVTRLDGTLVRVERIASAVEYEGRPAVQVVLRDISERKRLEAERERLLSDQRIRIAEQDAIFASMLVGMFIYDRHGHVIHVNQAAQEMLGYTDADITMHFTRRMAAVRMETSEGKPLLPEEAPASRALKGELVRDLPLRAHLRNGEICWMLANASPILDEQGQVFGAVLTVVDISARKKAEEALQESEARFRSVLDTTRMSLSA